MKDLGLGIGSCSNVPVSVSTQTRHRKLCFSDPSVIPISIAAVAYLTTISTTGQIHVGFVMARQNWPHTQRIQRPALSFAQLSEMADIIHDEMDIDIHSLTYYSDSKIVLGYIYNNSHRFYVCYYQIYSMNKESLLGVQRFITFST